MHNATNDLSSTDQGNFIGATRLETIEYDSINDGAFLGGHNGIFAYYNRSGNFTIDLSNTDENNWIGNSTDTRSTISSLAFDNISNGVYIMTENARFGYYNRAENVVHDLNNVDVGDWAGNTQGGLVPLAFDSINNGVYITIEAGALFGYYSKATNTSINLTGKIRSIGLDNPQRLAFDSRNDGVYIAGGDGSADFAYYSKATNSITDLSSTDEGDFLGLGQLIAIAYDYKNDGAYIIGITGIFGYYSRSTNITKDLSNTDAGNWIEQILPLHGNVITSLTYDGINDGVYLGGGGGAFGYYDKSDNVTYDLRSDFLISSFMGQDDQIDSVSFDKKNHGVYLSGTSGIFGYYSLNGLLTLTGLNVNVDLGSSVMVNFTDVLTSGLTKVTTSTEAPAPSTGFNVSGVYFDISTTANYTGNITITLPYNPLIVANASALKMYHYDKVLGLWVDVTLSVDTNARTVTGVVTSLSPFVLGIPIQVNFGGFIPPLREDEIRDFKLGSSIPVKFQLTDANGNFITDALASIFVAKVDNGIVGDEQEGTARNSIIGNIFRYDSNDNQYIFNLDTKSLSKGIWQIRVELLNGDSFTVQIKLVK